MPERESSRAVPEAVVHYPNRSREPEHETAVHRALAQRIAALLGIEFIGQYRPGERYAQRLYVVPSGTLVGSEQAQALGLASELDLFGGLVPEPFIETKAITHPLIGPQASAPRGWSHAFTDRVTDSVLPGFTAFSLADAREAGLRLLEHGAARLKPVRATGGRGQVTFKNRDELEQALQALDTHELAACGLVLEDNLEHVTTFSVGQVRVGGQIATYYGTQRLSPDNRGEQVYGGSDLVVVRGGFDALLDIELPERTRLAVSQAQAYDEAAIACYPGLLASRRNYDIAEGMDGEGQPRSGVLEQSWRIGGASSAEIAALEAFAADPGLRAVQASSFELYGSQAEPPPGATLLFRGEDAEVGFITKCATVKPHDDL
ncbi:DUF3182 family protein [Stutzerimonas urumqiensis]|uniref:DUF3182 family protein n=1 Tax=Stutzerimonas urumqiensis TaxID=638269 RepID=UPI000EB18E56|nr:DUF3182 family protein [Stutzerimonas urumqiensis]